MGMKRKIIHVAREIFIIYNIIASNEKDTVLKGANIIHTSISGRLG